jgi:single-strand DNA-binding protein
MSNVNTVVISGNLTRDPEWKEISETFSLANLGVAVNRQKKQADGSYEDEVSFFDVTVLGGYSKLVSKKLRKADSVTIQGRLEQQRWEQDGQNRSKVVLIVDGFDGGKIDSDGFFRSADENVELVSSGAASTASQPAPEAAPAAPAAAASASDIPF